MVCTPDLLDRDGARMGSAGHCAKARSMETPASSSLDMDRCNRLLRDELFPESLPECGADIIDQLFDFVVNYGHFVVIGLAVFAMALARDHPFP